MTGRRLLSIRRTTLRKIEGSAIRVREIVLWQRGDERYEVAITTHLENEPTKADVNDYWAGPSRAEGIAAFEEAVADSRREGFEGG